MGESSRRPTDPVRARIYCGAKLPDTVLEVPNPIVVVENLSPTTRRTDVTLKLAGYFRVPSVAHYLIVNPTPRLVIHHVRGSGDPILTRVVSDGVITLDPLGLALAVIDIFGD